MSEISSKEYAIVTGAASGIGKCVSELLISKGIIVFALDRKYVDISGVNYIKCDISSEVEIENARNCILTTTEKINYLVLAAGILCVKERCLIDSMSILEWSNVLATNLTGTMLSMRAFIPLMKNNAEGSIVTYSSEQVIRPIAKSAPYLVSKAGVEYLTKLAAIENLEYKIRVNCIRAAAVDTEFLSALVSDSVVREKMKKDMDTKMPLGIISPKDIAEMTLFLLSNVTSKMTGQIVTIDSGLLL